MTYSRSLRVLFQVVVIGTTIGCAKPVQSGGLGVFNPVGFEGRIALAGEYSANGSAPNNGIIPPKSPK